MSGIKHQTQFEVVCGLIVSAYVGQGITDTTISWLQQIFHIDMDENRKKTAYDAEQYYQ